MTPDNPIETLIARGITLACAESLTGGGLAARIVNTAGVSAIFRGAVVSYATDVKASVLGVSQERLNETGPVDEQVALQMARGACALLAADVALATTGVAGPGKPSCCIFPVIGRRYARQLLITLWGFTRVICEM